MSNFSKIKVAAKLRYCVRLSIRMQLAVAFVVIIQGTFHPLTLAESSSSRLIPKYEGFSPEWRKLLMLKRYNQLLSSSYHQPHVEQAITKLPEFILNHRLKRVCPTQNQTSNSKRAVRPKHMKRFNENYFADSWAEVEEKEKRANYLNFESNRLKREENDNATGGPLCSTSRNWTDLGPNHYPRFVLNIICTEHTCVNGSYRCSPRKFEVNILVKLNQTEECNFNDASLPVSLRPKWKLARIPTTHCCDCTHMY